MLVAIAQPDTINLFSFFLPDNKTDGSSTNKQA